MDQTIIIMKSIEICGYNLGSGLSSKIDNINRHVFIYPPIKSIFDPSTIISYSTFAHKSVVITIDGIAHGIGDNSDYQLSSSLCRQKYDIFTEIDLQDQDGDPCFAISAVCGLNYTLYIVSDGGKSDKNLLAYSFSGCKFPYPVILNTVYRILWHFLAVTKIVL